MCKQPYDEPGPGRKKEGQAKGKGRQWQQKDLHTPEEEEAWKQYQQEWPTYQLDDKPVHPVKGTKGGKEARQWQSPPEGQAAAPNGHGWAREGSSEAKEAGRAQKGRGKASGPKGKAAARGGKGGLPG